MTALVLARPSGRAATDRHELKAAWNMPTPRTMMASPESALGGDERVRPYSTGVVLAGFKGGGVLNIFALFRNRRAPRPRRKAGNGGWQDIGLTSLGGPMPAAR